jgi:RNA polymerase sigma-32 factor
MSYALSPQVALTTAPAPVSPWSLLPPLGNLDAYISAVNRLPMLTLEQEQEFAKKLKENNDLDAAGKLVLSHLRLVVSTSRKYLGYGLPHADLIQEGNIGLMKAVKRFDPDQGVRLVSYALHWIKAEMHEYILKNWRMVKVATTKAQRKLFFNLRSMKQGFKDDADVATHRDSLTEGQIDSMAKTLRVKREEVIEMEQRMSGGDVLLDPSPSGDGEDAFGPIAYLSDAAQEPTMLMESRQRDYLASDGITTALEDLDARSRRIVEERWLKVNDDGSGGMTLHDLAAEYKVSAERIRQIEVAAMKKMKKVLAAYA